METVCPLINATAEERSAQQCELCPLMEDKIKCMQQRIAQDMNHPKEKTELPAILLNTFEF